MAARTSNSVLRAVTVLQLLATEPSSSWSLAEIARRADLSYASAHSVASALEESGLVRRHPRTRAYTLGPARIVLGSAAQRGYRVVDDALPEMERLSQRPRPRVPRQRASRRRHGDARCHRSAATVRLAVQVGERVPIAPPLGLAFIAWADAATIEDYLDSSGRTLTARNVGSTPKPSRSCANEGTAWCSTARPVTGSSSASARPTELDDSRRHHELDEIIVELALDDYALVHGDAAAEYAVTALTAPVFGPDGEIILVLTARRLRGPGAGRRAAPVRGADVRGDVRHPGGHDGTSRPALTQRQTPSATSCSTSSASRPNTVVKTASVSAPMSGALRHALRETREPQRVADVALVADLGMVEGDDRALLEQVRVGVVVVRPHHRHRRHAVRLQQLCRVFLRAGPRPLR